MLTNTIDITLGLLGCGFSTTKIVMQCFFSYRLLKYSKLNIVRNCAFVNLYYNIIKYIKLEKFKFEIVSHD